ncbi:MAG TPA: hypothetical protein VED17_10345, partial [Nitrososphaerales archaeon]|nr:hypothetical protein [Nitrososphaerales archaeon]
MIRPPDQEAKPEEFDESNSEVVMSKQQQKPSYFFADPGHKTLYKVGGVTLVIIGICELFANLISFLPGNNGWASPPGVSAETFINTLARARGAYLSWGLFTIVDFLFVPVIVALYFAFKSVNRDALLVGLVILFMTAVLDAAVAEVGFFTATSLAASWAAATDPILKAAYFVSAQNMVMLTEFAFPYSFAGSFAGLAIISAVMRKRWKWIGWFGLVLSAFFSVSSVLFMIPA